MKIWQGKLNDGDTFISMVCNHIDNLRNSSAAVGSEEDPVVFFDYGMQFFLCYVTWVKWVHKCNLEKSH